MREVRWLRTVEGVPLAMPSASRILKGETVALDDGDADKAIADGLAEELTSAKARKKE